MSDSTMKSTQDTFGDHKKNVSIQIYVGNEGGHSFILFVIN